jgi:hypothetical protein
MVPYVIRFCIFLKCEFNLETKWIKVFSIPTKILHDLKKTVFALHGPNCLCFLKLKNLPKIIPPYFNRDVLIIPFAIHNSYVVVV